MIDDSLSIESKDLSTEVECGYQVSSVETMLSKCGHCLYSFNKEIRRIYMI